MSVQIAASAGCTPLIIAAMKGRADDVAALLANGANVNEPIRKDAWLAGWIKGTGMREEKTR